MTIVLWQWSSIVLQQTIDKVFLNIKQELNSVTDTPIQSKVKSQKQKEKALITKTTTTETIKINKY